jgi:benzoyl-CoA reductase/2-hydroxyglutaryl-CoA dehydratase subunit BcrC/BadD/HgdB
VVLRGDPRAESYYALLLAELEQRLARGEAAVDGERHRLYWEGMPIWGRLRRHAELFASEAACVVASTYCQSWVFDALADPNPWQGMARAYTELFIVRSEEAKERLLEQMFRAYQVDGVVYHDAKTCPANTNSRYGMPRRLTGRLGLPHIVVCGDLNDLRLCSDEQAQTQIEALLEQLDAGRGEGW